MSADKSPLLAPAKPKAPSSRPQGSYRLGPPRISFPSANTSSLAKPDEDDDGEGGYETLTSGRGGIEVDAPLQSRRRRPLGDVEGLNRREGVPKLSRECLWSEIKCYGSYIVPVLLIFGGLAIGLSLGIYGWKKGWFDRD